MLRAAKAHLDGGQGLRTLKLDGEQAALLAPLFPVSMKPSVLVADVDDSMLPDGGELAAAVRRVAAPGTRAAPAPGGVPTTRAPRRPQVRAGSSPSHRAP